MASSPNQKEERQTDRQTNVFTFFDELSIYVEDESSLQRFDIHGVLSGRVERSDEIAPNLGLQILEGMRESVYEVAHLAWLNQQITVKRNKIINHPSLVTWSAVPSPRF